MANAQRKEETKKVKRPTTIKRQMQDEQRRLRNKVVRSRTKTVIKSYLKEVHAKDVEKATSALQTVYSSVDKAVKIGVFKKNRASRIKARMASRLVAMKAA